MKRALPRMNKVLILFGASLIALYGETRSCLGQNAQAIYSYNSTVDAISIPVNRAHGAHDEIPLSREMTEALHGIWVVRGKIDSLNNKFDESIRQVLELIQQQAQDHSEGLQTSISVLYEQIEQDKQSIASYMEEMKTMQFLATSHMRDALPSYYNDTMRQCEQLTTDLQNIESAINTQLASLCLLLTQLFIELKTCLVGGFADNQVQLATISSIIIASLSEVAKIYAEQILESSAKEQQLIQETQETLFNAIYETTNPIITKVSAVQSELDAQIIQQATNIMSQVSNVGVQEQENYLKLEAAIQNGNALTQEQTVLLTTLLNSIQQSIENMQHALFAGLTCSQAQQTLTLQTIVDGVGASLQSLVNQNTETIREAIIHCCKELCSQIYTLHAQLSSQMRALQTDLEIQTIEQTSKLASKISAVDSNLNVRTGYLMQKIAEVDESIVNQNTLLHAQLACIESEISNEVIQQISDLSLQQVVNTNNIIHQIAQTRTMLSNEVASKISYAELQLVEQNNELYSKLCQIDSSISNNLSHGLLELEKQIAVNGMQALASLSTVESDIINAMAVQVADAVNELTFQTNAISSKISAAQADLIHISGEIENQECDLTEQNAAICSKISAVEARIFEGLALVNYNISNSTYAVTDQVLQMATQIAIIVRRSTQALEFGLEFALNLLTKLYTKIPII